MSATQRYFFALAFVDFPDFFTAAVAFFFGFTSPLACDFAAALGFAAPPLAPPKISLQLAENFFVDPVCKTVIVASPDGSKMKFSAATSCT